MSCPGYIGGACWDGNVVCIDGKKVDDDLLMEYCDDCRDDILGDMQRLYTERRAYIRPSYYDFDIGLI